MNKLLQLMSRDHLTLLVSLPANSAELAHAAVEGGAEALKVHINVHHDASGTHFGTFAEEQRNLQAIVEAAGKVPVGIVAGAERTATAEEMAALAAMGIDFFDLYAHHTPAWMLGISTMTRMVALAADSQPDEAVALEELGFQALEASVVHHDQYGQPLTAADLIRYRLLAKATSLPIVVPSQKRILVEEVPLLARTGVRALMIGAIVTGKEPDAIRATSARFRAACENTCL